MRRRSRGSGKRAKGQRRKAEMPKRRNAPKATRNRGASIAGQETVVARLTHERDEALLRETANDRDRTRVEHVEVPVSSGQAAHEG